jgi:hypothetical protein
MTKVHYVHIWKCKKKLYFSQSIYINSKIVYEEKTFEIFMKLGIEFLLYYYYYYCISLSITRLKLQVNKTCLPYIPRSLYC